MPKKKTKKRKPAQYSLLFRLRYHLNISSRIRLLYTVALSIAFAYLYISMGKYISAAFVVAAATLLVVFIWAASQPKDSAYTIGSAIFGAVGTTLLFSIPLSMTTIAGRIGVSSFVAVIAIVMVFTYWDAISDRWYSRK